MPSFDYNSQIALRQAFAVQYIFPLWRIVVRDTNLHNKDCCEMHSGICSQMTSSCKCPILTRPFLLCKSETSGGPMDNQIKLCRQNGRLRQSAFVWVWKPKLLLRPAFVCQVDCPVARQNFLLLSTAHVCAAGLLGSINEFMNWWILKFREIFVLAKIEVTAVEFPASCRAVVLGT